LVEKPDGKRPFGRHGSGWERILEWILRKQSEKLWNGFIWLKIGTGGGLQ
jgi:hypothetical protein